MWDLPLNLKHHHAFSKNFPSKKISVNIQGVKFYIIEENRSKIKLLYSKLTSDL